MHQLWGGAVGQRMIDIWLALCGLDGDLFQLNYKIDLDSDALQYKLVGMNLSEGARLSGAFSLAEQFILDEIVSTGYSFKLLQERTESFEKSNNCIENKLGLYLSNEVCKEYYEFLAICERDSSLVEITKILQKLKPWKQLFDFWLSFEWSEYILKEYSNEEMHFLNKPIVQWIQQCLCTKQEIHFLPNRLSKLYQKCLNQIEKIPDFKFNRDTIQKYENLEQILHNSIQQSNTLLFSILVNKFPLDKFCKFLDKFIFLNDSLLWNEFFISIESVVNVRRKNFSLLLDEYDFILLNEKWNDFDFCKRAQLFVSVWTDISSSNTWFLLYFNNAFQYIFNLLLSLQNAIRCYRRETNLLISLHVKFLLFLYEYFQQDIIAPLFSRFKQEAFKADGFEQFQTVIQKFIADLNEGLFIDAPFIGEKLSTIIQWKYNELENITSNMSAWKEGIKVLMNGMQDTITNVGHLPCVGMFLQRTCFNSFFLDH